eukprot:CAMPEP_0196657474 /NCGR_PEP_ID=MMETSP1086-20130531/23604_1 /TAXON_ID=77921 /ORGANISM="Cyanoptyche  gloeocystis , Strain SAG4.97" /LENGTH=131 /DNA_ID=CAMNT_0041990613 /DNA_START=238 /DNA_END=633 /DNA_ORIENTATION=+
MKGEIYVHSADFDALRAYVAKRLDVPFATFIRRPDSQTLSSLLKFVDIKSCSPELQVTESEAKSNEDKQRKEDFTLSDLAAVLLDENVTIHVGPPTTEEKPLSSKAKRFSPRCTIIIPDPPLEIKPPPRCF